MQRPSTARAAMLIAIVAASALAACSKKEEAAQPVAEAPAPAPAAEAPAPVSENVKSFKVGELCMGPTKAKITGRVMSTR